MITLNDLVYHVWKLEVMLQNLASLCINFCKICVSMEIIFILSSCSILVFESLATLYSFSLCVYVYIYVYIYVCIYIYMYTHIYICIFPLGMTGLILQSKGFSRVFSNTTVQNHQFFSAQTSL